jgi:hypothetical protein
MTVIFDMDGTIYDLYSIPGWLESIHQEDASIFLTGQSMGNLEEIKILIKKLILEKNVNFELATWLPKDASEEYGLAVIEAKLRWCASQKLPSLFENIHFLEYGTPKSEVVFLDTSEVILFDDNIEVREEFIAQGGIAFCEKEIAQVLRALLIS